MELFLLFGAIIAFTSAQRPSYAGFNPIGTPKLASRFRENSTTTSTTTPSAAANRVGNRNGGETTTKRLPIDARGDADLVDRISQWPRENQPFWFLNSKTIEKQRNTPVQGKTTGKGEVQGQQSPSRNAIPHDRQPVKPANSKHSYRNNKLIAARRPKQQSFRETDNPVEFVQFIPSTGDFEDDVIDRMPPFFFK